MNLKRDSKIYVAGHRGLVGSAIWNTLLQKGYSNLIGRNHGELDLLDRNAVKAFFDEEKPDAVILAAAYVGGIMANNLYRGDFIYNNLQIQQNVIGESFSHGVEHLLFLGSTCIYPRDIPQPMSEEALLTAPLEYTNEPYAVAKIAGIKLCESLNMQYGTNYLSVMPTNLYGPRDNFDLLSSHVLPAIIRKVHLAHLLEVGDLSGLVLDLNRRPLQEGIHYDSYTLKEIETLLCPYGITSTHLSLWGSGKPMREFLWSEDMADASVHILLHCTFKEIARTMGKEVRHTHINIGTGQDVSIRELAEMIVKRVGYSGHIHWDTTKPDGTPRKLIDVSKIHALGWHHKVELPDGISMLYEWYCQH